MLKSKRANIKYIRSLHLCFVSRKCSIFINYGNHYITDLSMDRTNQTYFHTSLTHPILLTVKHLNIFSNFQAYFLFLRAKHDCFV